VSSRGWAGGYRACRRTEETIDSKRSSIRGQVSVRMAEDRFANVTRDGRRRPAVVIHGFENAQILIKGPTQGGQDSRRFRISGGGYEVRYRVEKASRPAWMTGAD